MRQRVALWLTFTVVLLILYGSFFPFQFVSFSHWHLLEAMRRLHLARPSRGDLVANFLLYIPLGWCLTGALPRRWSRMGVLGVAVVCGTLLSYAIEILQTFASERISSLTDMAVNAAGLLYGTMDIKALVPGMAQGRAEPVSLGVLILWLAYRLAPFIPTMDWQKYKMALKPLLLHP